MENLRSSIHLDPSHEFRVRDDVDEYGTRTALIEFAALTVYAPTWLGDAAVIAATGGLIDALDQLRRNARQRLAAEHTGMPALPDGVVFAGTVGQFLDELGAGWQGEAPGTYTEAFGS